MSTFETSRPISLGISDPEKTTSNLPLHIVFGAITIAFFFSVTLPDREVGEVDLLGKLKGVSRIGAFLVIVAINLLATQRRSVISVAVCFTSFYVYLLYAAYSSTWSSLPGTTMAQAFTLALGLALSFAVARFADNHNALSLVVNYLTLILLFRALLMVCAQIAMNGQAIHREIGSVWHSTDAADTCGLAFLVLVGNHFILRSQLTRYLLVPGLIIVAALFVIAQNRMSMILNPLGLIAILLLSGHRKLLFNLVFGFCLAVPLVLVVDAYTGVFSAALGMTADFADRHDSSSHFMSFSGRDELWAIIWEEYQASPIWGLGYMVTSRTGEIDVWGKVLNFDAHNQLFHVLVTTGIVGFAIFMATLFVPMQLISRFLFAQGQRGATARFVAVIFGWMLLWGLLNVSFSGYINASLITFYVILGICVARFKLHVGGQ